MKQSLLLAGSAALSLVLLSSCTIGLYVPRIRDVTEERFDGDYWHQRFTLYNPANPASDCQIDRTGQRIDLSSPAQVADAWRVFCRTTTDNASRSDNN